MEQDIVEPEPIEHYRAKHNGWIPARFVMRDGKQYYLATGLPVRTISGTDDVCIHGYPADEPCDDVCSSN